MSASHLSVYLNDHLAGSTAALEILALLRKLDPAVESWNRIDAAVREDRATLEEIMTRAGVADSTLRKATAWVVEKLAELKVRLEDAGDGHLQRLQLIEALAIGIDGKRALWSLLQTVTASQPAFRGVDFAGLIQRAVRQREEVEGRRLAAGAAALAVTDGHR